MIFRCSSLDRILRCNGSILLAPLFPSTESAEATEGTALHFLIARRAVLELGATEPEGGIPEPKFPAGWQLPAFSAWIVDWAVRLLQEEIPAGWSLMVEEAIAYNYYTTRLTPLHVAEFMPDPKQRALFTLSGHLDILAISPCGKHAKGIDWKTGQVGADPAECNLQASGYLGLMKRAWPELESAEFILAQPRIDEESTGIERVSRVKLDGAALDRVNNYLAEEITKALENAYETDSGIKQCKYCEVAKHRPWLCPSLKKEIMKANFTNETIEAMKAAPDDGKLADFVLAGRTIAGPTDAAEELLKERIAAQGYVDSASGARITIKVSRGAYEVTSPLEFLTKSRALLGTDDRIAQCFKPSVTKVKEQIADAKGIPKTSKKETSAESVFDAELRPFVTQGERKTLVISNT